MSSYAERQGLCRRASVRAMSQGQAPDFSVVATSEHVACTVEGEAVILHLQEGVYYGLNTVGTRVWELVQTPRRFSEIVAFVVGEFDVPQEQCESDLAELLTDLQARGLVRHLDA